MGIKKIYNDEWQLEEKKTIHDAEIASVFISNSDHLSNVYRSAFGYNGPIWKCGYPKNDILFQEKGEFRKKLRKYYGIDADVKLILYAPTFRSQAVEEDISNLKRIYSIDFTELCKTLCGRFGGKWISMVRMHPNLADRDIGIQYSSTVLDVTAYPDMQELIMACDAFISDYSSCIFDAAMTGIPCFTFANDFDDYKGYRGVYYEMEELPFPYAKNNDELMRNIDGFEADSYAAEWKAFTERTGLYETGHAAKDVAQRILSFINGKKIVWK